MSSRTIHLRRPPVLSIAETPFVPPALATHPKLADEIERRWSALRARNPNYFDGRLFHVLNVSRNGHGGATLHVMECAYRYHAVQTPDFDLGQRALGVKGVTTRIPPPSEGGGKGVGEPINSHLGIDSYSSIPISSQTRQPKTESQKRIAENPLQYLFGLRSPTVAAYQNLWEFAPAGGVEPGTDPATIARQELIEETGYAPQSDPVAIAVMFDDVLNCWELVYRMSVALQTKTSMNADGVGEPIPHTDEYLQLVWRTLDDLPSPLSPIAHQIAKMLNSQTS